MELNDYVNEVCVEDVASGVHASTSPDVADTQAYGVEFPVSDQGVIHEQVEDELDDAVFVVRFPENT